MLIEGGRRWGLSRWRQFARRGIRSSQGGESTGGSSQGETFVVKGVSGEEILIDRLWKRGCIPGQNGITWTQASRTLIGRDLTFTLIDYQNGSETPACETAQVGHAEIVVHIVPDEVMVPIRWVGPDGAEAAAPDGLGEITSANGTVPTAELIDAVGAHPAVFQVIILSHRKIGITAVFRAEESGEREDFERFLREQRVIPEGFRAFELPVRQDSELTEEACRVLAGMAYDARRPLSWLARKTKLPQRRVSAVVDTLIRDGSVIFTLDLATGTSSGTWAELEVEGVNVAAELSAVAQSRRHLLWLSPFAGTQTWYAWVWCESAGALQTLVESLTSRSLMVKEAGVILSTHGYPVWVHDELVHRSQASSH